MRAPPSSRTIDPCCASRAAPTDESPEVSTRMAASTSQPSFLATRRGKLTLALLAAIAFLDFVDASITNVALPSIRHALHFSEADLQWVPSAYLLTYGGFMLLGGRAADLLGRRRVLVAGNRRDRRLLAGRRARRKLGRAGRRPPRAGTRRGDDAARRALDPDHDVQGRQGPQHRARRVGRGRRPRVRRRGAPRRPADRRAGLAVGDVRQPDRVRARPAAPSTG